MKKVVVISLGGSLIIPSKIDLKFLEELKKILRRFSKTHKFVVVCGGGPIARKYMSLLKKHGKSKKEIALGGIKATRMNAEIVSELFNSNSTIPKSMNQVKNNLSKNNITFCGALRYHPKETSDGTAAKLANYLKTIFINITNVSGLHNKDPKKYNNTKLIPNINWKAFEIITNKKSYKPGQHFVLDHNAASIIRKNKIPTYIIGKDLKNIEKILKNKPFKGTLIKD